MSQSDEFNSIKSQNIVLNENNKLSILSSRFNDGMYILPSPDVPGRISIIGNVLTASSEDGKVEWKDITSGTVTVPGSGRLWFSDNQGDAIGDSNLIWTNNNLGINTPNPQYTLDVSGDTRLRTLYLYDNFNPLGMIAIDTPGNVVNSYTITLPPSQGNENQIMALDNNGRLQWIDQGGVGPIVGGDGALWYSNAGGYPMGNNDRLRWEQFNSRLVVQNTIAIENDSNVATNIKTSVNQLANITLTLPPNVGSNNQVLTTDGAGNLSWKDDQSGSVVPGAGKVWFSDATGVAIGSDNLMWSGSTFNIKGSLRLSEFSTITIKQSSSQSIPYTLTLPQSPGSSNQVLTTDGAGNLSWKDDQSGSLVPGAGKVWFSDATGSASGSDNLFWDGSSLGVRGYVSLTNSNNYSNILLTSSSQSTNITLTLPQTVGTNNQVLTTDGAGTLSWTTVSGGSLVTGTGKVWFSDGTGSATGSDNLVWSGSILDVNGSISLTNTNNYSNVIRTSSSQATNVTYSLPLADGQTNQVLTTNGFGALTWTTITGGNKVLLDGAIWRSDQDGNPVASNIYQNNTNISLYGTLQLIDPTQQGSAYNAIRTSPTQTFAVSYTLPKQYGTTDQVLTLDASTAQLSWTDKTKLEGGYGGAIWVNSGITGKPVATDLYWNGSDKSLFVPGSITLRNPSSGIEHGIFISSDQADYVYMVLPSNYGTVGQVLTTNGAGTLSWTTVSGGGSLVPGAGKLWFSDGTGSATGSDNLVWSGTNLDIRGNVSLTNSNNYSNTIVTSSSQSTNITLTLPPDLGAGNQVLTTDGAGNLTWTNKSGGGGSPTVPGEGSLWYSDASGLPIGSDTLLSFKNVLGKNHLSVYGSVTLRNDTGYSMTISQASDQGEDIDLIFPAYKPYDGAYLTYDQNLGHLRWMSMPYIPSVVGIGYIWYTDVVNPQGSDKFVWDYNNNILKIKGKISLIDANNRNVQIYAPDDATSNSIFILPNNIGSTNQVLCTSGNGITFWKDQITFDTNPGLIWYTNPSGTGSTSTSGFSFDNATNTLNVPNIVSSDYLLSKQGLRINNRLLGTNYVQIEIQNITQSYTLTLPQSPGSSGQVLTTDGNGALTWTNKPTISTVSGTGKVWYSDGTGLPTGDNNLLWSNNELTIKNRIKLLNSGNYTITLQQSPSQTLNYTLTLPQTSGNPNQVLTTDGNGTLTWNNQPTIPTVSGTGTIWYSDGTGSPTGNTSGFTYIGSRLTLNSTLSLISTTVGGLTRLNIMQNSNQGNEYTLTLPIDGGVSGQILETDGTGNLSWTNKPITPNVPNGGTVWFSKSDGTATGSGKLYYSETFDTLYLLDGALFALTNSLGSTVTLKQASSQNIDYTLTLPLNAGTAGQVLTTDGAGKLSWVNDGKSQVSGVGKIWYSDATGSATGSVNLITDGTNELEFSGGRITAATLSSRDIELTNNGFTLTLKPYQGMTVDYTLTLPQVQGTAGQILQNDGTGALTWVDQSVTPPAGVNGSIQYKIGSTFSGNDIFTFDGNNVLLTNSTFDSNMNVDTLNVGELFSVSFNGDVAARDIVANDISSVALTASGLVSVGTLIKLNPSNNTITSGQLLISNDSGKYNKLITQNSQIVDINWVLPQSPGTNGQVLTTDGTGTLSWTTVSGGGGTPGAPPNSVQVNVGGAFGGFGNFTYDGTNLTLGTIVAESVNNTITAGQFITASDRRLKQNIQPLDVTLDNLNPVSYTMDNTKRYGLIAQEVMDIPEFEHIVRSSKNRDGNEMLAIDYIQLIPALINQIKKLESRIKMLEITKC